MNEPEKNIEWSILPMPNKSVLLVLLALILSACATDGGMKDGPSAPMPEVLEQDTRARLPHTNPDVLYYVGAAEIAGMRAEADRDPELRSLAADYYARAAAISEDPAIAAQALKVAAFANSEELTLQGVDRWLALQPDNLEPHRYAAILHLRRGDVETAWKHVAIILERNRSPEAWGAVGKMIAGVPERPVARAMYLRIAETFQTPPNEELRSQMSDLGVQLGEFAIAERYATEVLELNDQRADTYGWRGRLRTSLNRFDDARADFERSLELAPDDQQMRQSYAALLAELEDYEGAIAQLAEVDKTMVSVFSQGIYANAAGLDDRAIEFYEELQGMSAGDEDEDESERFYLLGQMAETIERPYEETLGWYDKVRSGERLDNAQLRSAVVLGQNDQLAQARVVLKRLQNGNAQTAANAFLAEAGLLRDADQLDDALAVYSRGLAFLPDNTDLLLARALMAEQLNQLDLAENDLRKVLELRPNDPNALNALGYTLADRTDRYDEALQLIERALMQMPNEAAFVDSMGWVQFKLGNLDQALEYLQRALELQYDGEIAAHLGEVLWVMGREDDARELWTEALEREPDSEILQSTMSRFVD
jgi:tetratricopeptide (TPR) repeat protein